MYLMYSLSMGTSIADGGWAIGTFATDWTNDVLFGEIVPNALGGFLESIGVAGWLYGLIMDGIVAGVGAVLGFVPQMLVLFFLLSILEDIGYMSRVAFIMDRIFRKFGLSGKSFIPVLVGTGCGVPGVMASRTIENERDRRMTIMTTCFIPCGAKMPIIGLIAGALFGGSSLVAVSAYFIGMAAIICSGIILKKTKAFAGDPAPFVMELPAYHIPAWAMSSVLPGARLVLHHVPAPSFWLLPSSCGSCRASASRTAPSAWSRIRTTPSWLLSQPKSLGSSRLWASATGRLPSLLSPA